MMDRSEENFRLSRCGLCSGSCHLRAEHCEIRDQRYCITITIDLLSRPVELLSGQSRSVRCEKIFNFGTLSNSLEIVC